MPRTRSDARPLVVCLTSVAIVAVCWVSSARIGRGQQNPAQPTELLKRAPFDRITLSDNTVIEVEPISPRPLPPFDASKDDTGKKDANKADTKKEAAKEGGSAGTTKTKKSSRRGDEPAQINELIVHAQEGDVRDFRIRRAFIRKVEYFEDMLIAEGEKYIQTRDYAKAFEYFLAVQLRTPDWKGLDERIDQLLYEEGTWALTDDPDRGARLLRELYSRKPTYPNLKEKLAEAYGGRVDRALRKGAFRDARRVLHEMETIDPDGSRTGEAKAQLVTRAKQLAAQAENAKGSDKLDKLVAALRVWPKLDGAAEAYNTAFAAEPTLDVGVVDMPRPAAPWVRTLASDRVARLIYRPLLARDDEEALKGKYPEQLIESMDVTDLGKRLVLQIREGIPWSDGSRPVAAIDLIRALSDRAEPRSPAFNARWAEMLERVQINDDRQIEVRLLRAPLNAESWLLNAIGPAHAGWDGWVSITGEGRKPVGNGTFQWDSDIKGVTSYRLAPRAQSAGSVKVHRIREIRVPTANAAVGAILRGEVTLLEHVPSDRLQALGEDKEIKVGKYSNPVLHRIAIDGRNPVLRNRSLRRGLSSAIDRKAILEETVLKHPGDAANTPSSGAFAVDSASSTSATEAKPLVHDALIARMLVTAARREMGNAPIKLTLQYPAIPEAQAAVPKIAEALIAAGIDLKTIERPESELEEALRAGEKFDLAYRAGPCRNPIIDAGPFLCPPYDAPPSANGLGSVATARILQLLLELEHEPDVASAKATLATIDRETRDELPILPLWQLEDHYAWRTRLRGPADQADRLYEGIDGWEIDPWFAKDPW
jgi:peptide/nickel transport system substrate-binding protein